MGRPPGWVAERTGRLRCGRQADRVSICGKLSRHSGCVLLQELRAKTQHWQAACRNRLVLAGSARPADGANQSGPCSGRFLSFAEREELALLNAQGSAVREIARRMERSPSTVSRELRRNATTRGGVLHYRATVAQWKADRMASRPRPPRLRRTRDCALTYKTDSLAMSLLHEASRSGTAGTMEAATPRPSR